MFAGLYATDVSCPNHQFVEDEVPVGNGNVVFQIQYQGCIHIHMYIKILMYVCISIYIDIYLHHQNHIYLPQVEGPGHPAPGLQCIWAAEGAPAEWCPGRSGHGKFGGRGVLIIADRWGSAQTSWSKPFQSIGEWMEKCHDAPPISSKFEFLRWNIAWIKLNQWHFGGSNQLFCPVDVDFCHALWKLKWILWPV